MNMEEHFINKTYFQTLVDESSLKYPVKALGTSYYHEQMNEGDDLSSIRFAQGEVYYHHKDMEAAIYKWGNVKGDHSPWAKKNIGDAYYDLGWLKEAEKTYTSIQTDSTTLSVEVALQLLALYSEQNQQDKALKYIEKALTINPDYPNVTDIARTFYEDRQDWSKAVDLAAKEAVRTESLNWFIILNEYVENGRTLDLSPTYFEKILLSLYEVNKQQFSIMVKSLWHSYQEGPSSLAWLKTMNDIFNRVNVSSEDDWKIIAQLHYDSYLQLMSGQYFISDLKTVLPGLVRNWLNLTTGPATLFPATASLAWDEFFPNTLDEGTLQKAERMIIHRAPSNEKTREMTDLLDTILIWAEVNEVSIEPKQSWLLSQIRQFNKKFLLIRGLDGKSSHSVMNVLLGEDLLTNDELTTFIQPGADRAEMNEISETGMHPVADMNELNKDAVVELSWPTSLLRDLNGTIIHAKSTKEAKLDSQNIADGILYVVEGGKSISDREYDHLKKWKERNKQTPVHFVINEMDREIQGAGLDRVLLELFPSAKQFIISSRSDGRKLQEFILAHFSFHPMKAEQLQPAKLLYLIRSSLTYLLQQRVTKEHDYKEDVSFNDEVRNKLKGLINHLEDSKSEKSTELMKSYQSLKEEMKKKVWDDIPPLLRATSEELDEESDFRKIHAELNEKMNRKIDNYLSGDLIPSFQAGLKAWLLSSRTEMSETQQYLNEMSDAFNKMYGDARMNLQCDFQVLEDWKRDLTRMINRAEVKDINIMNRLNPSQILLKSAGKLLGNMQSNKQVLYQQYQKYIKNDSFDHVAHDLIEQFFIEFDMFEKALKSDIIMAFDEPLDQVREFIDEAESEIVTAKEKLEVMKENPDSFYDPLKVFEVRYLQYEMMDEVSEKHTIKEY
ncbi:hypothetical protein CR194_16235 [Salipaludibacillus keqinensis]|uniref:Uncharacterized protein n=1 Tax=Salipaludibacillus keqinensis TaxID=2045207 RepID=A0A323TA45_9BACI|nr:hypothetical protein [Salipaludibacillus keqinensis]PYZ92378.1 hypothetical protein CR194_16235 [Salipaludibacillus keqinensis]